MKNGEMEPSSRSDRSSARRIGIDELDRLLGTVLRLPKTWIYLMLGVALVSSITVDHPADQGWGMHFAITSLTLGAIALLWLPALLRLLSLAGGKLKGAGMEVSSGGLIGTPEDLIGDLASIRTGAEQASRKVSASEAGNKMNASAADEMLRRLQEQVDEMAAEYLRDSNVTGNEAITQLADRYEKIRRGQEAGTKRTIEMTRLVNEARVRASANPEEARRAAGALVRSKDEGKRIIGLAFLQEHPSRQELDAVTKRIANSNSAFEMFNALVSLRELAPLLEPEEADSAIAVLEKEKTDPRGVDVMKDPNLPTLLNEVIAALRAPRF
jgi:hypothetical protein